MFLFGYSWSIAVSVFNGILQADFPIEIRSRIIGIYCVFFAGAQALGGYFSGVLVHQFGSVRALIGISTLTLFTFIVYYFMNIYAKTSEKNLSVSS